MASSRFPFLNYSFLKPKHLNEVSDSYQLQSRPYQIQNKQLGITVVHVGLFRATEKAVSLYTCMT